MICEIISSYPWACGDGDCPAQWHLANVWCDSDSETGYTIDHYSDGDHESAEKSDIPSAAQMESAWREYAGFVAKTGTDPIGNYTVARTITKKAKYRLRFALSILGVRLFALRRNRTDVSLDSIPENVRSYFTLSEQGLVAAETAKSLDDLRALALKDESCKLQRSGANVLSVLFSTTEEIPRSEKQIARDLRAAARLTKSK